MGVVANYPLALATGLGLNAFVAFPIATSMSWPDAMGLVVLEGLVILVLVLTGLREAVFARHPAPAEEGDQRRHRPVHRPDRVRRRRVRPAHPDAAAAVPVELGRGRPARRLAGRGLLRRPAADRSCSDVTRVKGAILIGIVVGDRPRDRRRGDRRHRPGVRAGQGAQPDGWNLNVPTSGRTRSSTRLTSR